MADESKIQPSFTPSRRWKIGFDVVLRTVLVVAVAVMVNFIATHFFHRFYLSSHTRIALAPRTVSVLHSLTNKVAVTLYYDHRDDFYPDIVALLNEYSIVNPKISVRTVDYLQNPGEAQKVKETYGLNATTDRNLIVFDGGANRVKTIPGNLLVQTTLAQIPNQKEREYQRKPVSFSGEVAFTSALLALQSTKPFNAYFLQGHGEPDLDDSVETGYMKFASILRGENYVRVLPLRLLGNDEVPDDCNLLILAGPSKELDPSELQKISHYLGQGGRMLVLLNYFSIQKPTGIEDLLMDYGVNTRADVVHDPENHYSDNDVVVWNFADHPAVASLTKLALELVLPRPVSGIVRKNPPANAPKVKEIALTGPNATLLGARAEPAHTYSLAAAVEQPPVAGVSNARGNMRMIVVGDSFFLDNQLINVAANREFLGSAVNWLLDRPQLISGLGPRPVTEFHLNLTNTQRRNISWLLLGAFPGAVLLLGGLVWFVRRK